jgi:hypothetical protein
MRLIFPVIRNFVTGEPMRFAEVSLSLALLFTSGCATQQGKSDQSHSTTAEQADPKLNDFFVKWLEGHNEKEIVSDKKGVGIVGNSTRLRAKVLGSKKHERGGYIVEVEFRIEIPPYGEIVEGLSGLGVDEEKAVNDALLNFTLTTFHVVYKGFINNNDPHQTVEKTMIAGREREVFIGDILTRGKDAPRLDSLRPKILAEIKKRQLSNRPHWIKIVYTQIHGKPDVVAALLDNNDDLELVEKIKQLDWPVSENVYIAKQFILIK